MDKNILTEELLNHLTESPSSRAERRVVEALAQKSSEEMKMQPPADIWRGIQKKISEQPHEEPSLADKLRALFSPPLVPALALGIAGVLVGAFLLLNNATSRKETQLIELSAVTPKKTGEVILAKGMRIENTTGGAIAHASGVTEKITLLSGAWKMEMDHNALEKPVQFFFPGGALEPIGTAFTIQITPQGTVVDLSQGKIRLYEFESSAKKWKATEIGAPYHGSLKPAPVTTELTLPEPEKEKPKAAASRFSAYVGRNVTLELKNGDRLSGKLKAAAGGKIILVSSAGTLTVRETDVVQLGD